MKLADYQISTRELIERLQEMRTACGACCYVILKHGLMDELNIELRAVGVTKGFADRSKDCLAKARGEL